MKSYPSQFREAIKRNIKYWIEYPNQIPDKEILNICSAIKFGFNLPELIENIEYFLKSRFEWIENSGNLSLLLNELGIYAKNWKNKPDINLWIVHIWANLLWNVGQINLSIEVNLDLYTREIVKHDSILSASIAYCIGRGYWSIEQNSLAIKYARMSLLAVESSNQNSNLFGLINNLLGIIYSQQGKTSEAIKLFKLVNKHFDEENNILMVADSFHNLSQVYESVGEYQSALKYYGKAAQTNFQQNSWERFSKVEVARGLLYYKLGRLENALSAFERGLKANEKNQYISPGWIYLVRGYVFMLQGSYLIANKDFQNSNDYWQKANREDLQKYSSEALSLVSGYL